MSLPTDPGCLGCRRDASAGFERCFFLLTISHIFSPRLAKCVPGERDRYALPRLPAKLQITERRKNGYEKKKHSAETGALAESLYGSGSTSGLSTGGSHPQIPSTADRCGEQLTAAQPATTSAQIVAITGDQGHKDAHEKKKSKVTHKQKG